MLLWITITALHVQYMYRVEIVIVCMPKLPEAAQTVYYTLCNLLIGIATLLLLLLNRYSQWLTTHVYSTHTIRCIYTHKAYTIGYSNDPQTITWLPKGMKPMKHYNNNNYMYNNTCYLLVKQYNIHNTIITTRTIKQ